MTVVCPWLSAQLHIFDCWRAFAGISLHSERRTNFFRWRVASPRILDLIACCAYALLRAPLHTQDRSFPHWRLPRNTGGLWGNVFFSHAFADLCAHCLSDCQNTFQKTSDQAEGRKGCHTYDKRKDYQQESHWQAHKKFDVRKNFFFLLKKFRSLLESYQRSKSNTHPSSELWTKREVDALDQGSFSSRSCRDRPDPTPWILFSNRGRLMVCEASSSVLAGGDLAAEAGRTVLPAGWHTEPHESGNGPVAPHVEPVRVRLRLERPRSRRSSDVRPDAGLRKLTAWR